MEKASHLREFNYIICVDDEQIILNQIATQLEETFGEQYTIEYAESAEEALELIEDIAKDGGYIRLVISDQMMPGMKGDKFLEVVNQKCPEAHKILLTGYAGIESAMYAINYAGLDKYIEKPWDREDLIATVGQLLQQHAERHAARSGDFRVRDALHNVLIFRDLAVEELNLITEKLQLMTYPKDSIIFNIDDPGDCMYIIKTGEVKVIAGVGTRGEVLAYLGRGNYFGEMALLTGEPRSASVVAVVDSEIFMLTKQDFDYLLQKYPAITLALSHVLSQRLRKLSIQKAGRQNKLITVLNTLPKAHQKPIVIEIARRLLKETNGKVVLIDIDVSQAHIAFLLDLEREPTSARWIIENLDTVKEDELSRLLPQDPFGVKFFILPPFEDIPLPTYFLKLLGVFKEFYTFVLINFIATGELDLDTEKAMEQADTVLYLFEQFDAKTEQDFSILHRLQHEYSDILPKLDVVAVRGQESPPLPAELSTLVDPHRIHFLRLDQDPVQFLFRERRTSIIKDGVRIVPQINRDVSRIARRLGNVSVGLVLGGGGARAYAHLGVLKVLEEARVPIDMIAGTSMGAFIAALYVLGKSTDEILKLSFENWKKLLSPVSWAFPRVALIKAKRIRQITQHILGDVLIEDLPIPFFCVAGDLVTGQEVVFSQGKLYEAILATGALPGFFPPIAIRDMQLVDGGVVNNVPGDVLKKQGMDIVIAVDVTPEREARLLTERPPVYQGSTFQRFMQYIKYIKSRYGTALLPRIIMRVIAIEGLEITRNKSRYFDIHIKPNLEDFDLFDFRKMPQIVTIGEQTGRQELAKIQDAIESLKR